MKILDDHQVCDEQLAEMRAFRDMAATELAEARRMEALWRAEWEQISETARVLQERLEAARGALVYAVGTANGLLMIPRSDPLVVEEINSALDTLKNDR